MKIRAFHGLRYNGNPQRAGATASPPYDQINDRRRDAMHHVEHHFAHLIRPVAVDGTGAHEHSAALHSQWMAEDVLVRDDVPTLYGNSIEPPDGETRLGLTALIDLEHPASGVIRPHEETVEKTVAERLSLLRTTRIDYEPILVLADDKGALEDLLAADCTGEPLAEHVDEDGNTHRLYRIAGAERLARYRAILETSYCLIADGHHRYKTASLYAEEVGAERGTAAAAKLGVITSLESTALAIDPIHRAFGEPFEVSGMEEVAIDRDTRRDASGAELARAVAEAPQPTLAILTGDGDATLWRLDPAHGPDDLPPAASQLAVVLLHRTLFPRARLSPQNATDGTVGYLSNADELAAAVREGEFHTAVFLPPMTSAGFAAAVAKGDVLPPKSTRFLPKVVSGLVWAAHVDPIE
jgi:uncharacterized protein (DUF1015 family)